MIRPYDDVSIDPYERIPIIHFSVLLLHDIDGLPFSLSPKESLHNALISFLERSVTAAGTCTARTLCLH